MVSLLRIAGLLVDAFRWVLQISPLAKSREGGSWPATTGVSLLTDRQ